MKKLLLICLAFLLMSCPDSGECEKEKERIEFLQEQIDFMQDYLDRSLFIVKDSFEFNGDKLYITEKGDTIGILSGTYYKVVELKFQDTSLLRNNYVYDREQNTYPEQTEGITSLVINGFSTVCNDSTGRLLMTVNNNLQQYLVIDSIRKDYVFIIPMSTKDINSINFSFDNNCYNGPEENRDIFIYDIKINSYSYLDSLEINVDPALVNGLPPGRNLFGVYLPRQNDNITVLKYGYVLPSNKHNR